MTTINLPTMAGDQPATFLAALGVLALLTDALDQPDARLWWDDPAGPAALDSDFRDRTDLGDALSDLARRMVQNDELLPGCGRSFPPRKVGKDPDPTRRLAFGEAQELATASKIQLAPPSAWLHAVFATNTMNSIDSRAPGAVCRHPLFDAGPGTVSMSTTLSSARGAAAAGAVSASIEAPRRVRGSIGGYLDWKGDRDASQASSARDTSTAWSDPVLAWLGLMAIRLTVVIGSGDRAITGLTPPSRSRFLRKPLVWPVWRSPRNASEVESLLLHSAIHDLEDVVEELGDGRLRSVGVRMSRPRSDEALRSLGLTAVFGSSRLSKGNNDGAYGPPVQIWPGK